MNILKRVFRYRANGMSESVYAVTDVGKQRKNNEDCYLLLPEMNIYVVADGMGGKNAGEVASLNAVKAIGGYFTPERTSAMKNDKGKIEGEMMHAVKSAHEKLLEMSGAKREHAGMGSTIIVSFIHDNVLHTCHVGDSRVYVINISGITQVTNDHSVVGELVRLGEITSEEARYSPRKNEITQALGAPTPIRPEYNQHSLRKRDVVLLCSDGLWEMLLDQEIHRIVLKQRTMKKACMELTRQANAVSGDDNITVVLVQIDGNGTL